MTKYSKQVLVTIVAWLGDRDSHSIYDNGEASKSFVEATGEHPEWPVHSRADTERAIANRGLGGHVNEPPSGGLAYGYEMADWLARKYAGFTSDKTGRGFLFRDCLEALRREAAKAETAVANEDISGND